ncbi:MAG: hypothetical protein ACHQ1H_12520 [Nitrososphaerales archaeon]
MDINRYSRAKTKFVREKIKETWWEDRALINICLDFEEIISRGGPWQWAQAMVYNVTRQKYNKEWCAIFQELKPREYARFLERERRERIEDEKLRERHIQSIRQKEALEREEWRKARGRILERRE